MDTKQHYYRELGLQHWAFQLERPELKAINTGNTPARLMIIGDNLDQTNEPIHDHDKTGRLLIAMLKAIGLSRSEVIITPITHYQPIINNNAPADTATQSHSIPEQQMTLTQPRLLLAMGDAAAHHLLGVQSSLESLRNQIHYYGDNKIPLIVTYHPAYLLDHPADKKHAYIDLQLTQRTLNELDNISLTNANCAANAPRLASTTC